MNVFLLVVGATCVGIYAHSGVLGFGVFLISFTISLVVEETGSVVYKKLASLQKTLLENRTS